MSSAFNQLNTRLTDRLPPRRAAILAGIGTFLVLCGYVTGRGWMRIPPHHSGDEPHYISIGWEFAAGHGFQRDFRDSDFRAFYRRYQREPPKVSQDDGSPDTTRPPLFPIIIAALKTITPGYEIWPVRLWNLFCLSFVCGLVVRTVAVRYGTLAGLSAVPLFLLLDTNPRLYGRSILSEPTAALLVALMAICLMKFCGIARYFHRVHLKSLIWLAFGMVLAVYDRTSLLLWGPFILFGMVLSLRHRNLKAWLIQSLQTTLLFSGVVLLLYCPWVVRNLKVTDAWMPTGTQAGVQMSAAYSDYAWESRGVWVNLERNGFFSGLETTGMTPIESRIAKARLSRRAANRWIREHPGKTACLPFLKIWQSIRPHSVSEAVLLFLALLGFCSWKNDPMKISFLILITACLAGVGATWSVEGRFLVPLLFVWHCLAAVGISRICGLKLSET